MNSEWKSHAIRLLREYARNNETLTSEEAFQWAHSMGLPLPAHHNQRGQAFREALIVPNLVWVSGTTRSKEKAAKGRKIAVYKSVVCSYFNEHDPTQKYLADLEKRFKLREIGIKEVIRLAHQFGLSGSQ